MNVYMSKLTFGYDDKGAVTDAIVGFNGMDNDGQYTDSNVKVLPADLPEGQTFDTVNNKALIELGRTKLINYLKPAASK